MSDVEGGRAQRWLKVAGVVLAVVGLWLGPGIMIGISLGGGQEVQQQPLQQPCVCKAESCPAAPVCLEASKLLECPAPLAPAACPEVECTEQVVSFGDYFVQIASQAENQLQPLKIEFNVKKAELDPIFARAKELGIGPRQAWVGNPEAVQVYLTLITRVGELEALWTQMQHIIQGAQSRMDSAWYENPERHRLWSFVPQSAELYHDQLQALTERADENWFTYLCAWDIEKRSRAETSR